MIFRRIALALAALLALGALPLVGQVVPAAEAGGLPIVAGAGVSGFNIDWGHDAFGRTRYMEGATLWIDWNLTRLPGPSLLRGLGVELEGRDINYGLPASLSNTELQDTGKGIAPEIVDRLFQAFATHGKAHGTGLGLSICKKIVLDHHGRIYARNAEKGGAVFGFSLPIPVDYSGAELP